VDSAETCDIALRQALGGDARSLGEKGHRLGKHTISRPLLVSGAIQ
jgi:hypothetical protein